MAKKPKQLVPASLSSSSDSDNDLARIITGLAIVTHTTPHLNAAARSFNMPKASRSKKSRRQPKRNIVREFKEYFGDESKLVNWQRMCVDLHIEADLSSLTKCRNALRGIWINIYDFLDEINGHGEAFRFPSSRALAAYTIDTNQIYPKKKAKKEGPVRALLAHIFQKD